MTEPGNVVRVEGRSGELVIRASGDDRELIVNGVYLMDTRRDGDSERVLARAAVAMSAQQAPNCLIGGLGFGYTLVELLAVRPEASVTCVELEPAVVEHYEQAGGIPAGVRVVVGDVVDWLAADPERYDVVLLDVDNGPSWTVREQNLRLYDDDGVRLLASRLAAGGVLGVWSAQPEPSFARRLATVFTEVHQIEVPVERGAPDVVYLAQR